MAEILLTSEKFIKEVTNVSDNLSGKFLQSSIREAQEVKLKGILGESLLDKCKYLIKENQIGLSQNAAYKSLVDNCQYYLAYTTLVDLCVKCSYKLTNFGVAKSSDENLQVATWEEIVRNQAFYQAKADSMCMQLQNWILDNKESFPELNKNNIHKIKSNLYSAATCGIWLGGARGKVTYRK